jgi:hypothetical protein
LLASELPRISQACRREPYIPDNHQQQVDEMIFFQDVTLILLTLILFTCCGWSVIAPFGHRLDFPVACATLSGVLLLSCTALAVHVVLTMTYWKAALVASGMLISLSLVAFFFYNPRDPLKELPCVILAGVGLAVGATLTATRTDIFFGGPALFYYYGTDHLGYAHMADWINSHVENIRLTASPDDPYASYPDYLLTRDPRFGSFSLLALISAISRRSATFAYDLTCGIVLAAASLGVSAIFSRARAVFILLAVSLFTSVWFDIGQIGYLGKMIGFPGTLLAVGLFFELCRMILTEEELPLTALCAVAAVVTCAVTMFNAQFTALALAVFGSLFIATSFNETQCDLRAIQKTARSTLILVALIVLAIVSSGTIARPIYFHSYPVGFGWATLTDWASQVVGPSGTMGPAFLVAFFKIIMTAVLICVCIYAVARKSAAAIALALGSLAIAVVLYAFNQQWQFYEISTLYAAMPVCAAAPVLNRELFLASRLRFWCLVALFFLVPIGIGIPRYAASLATLGGDRTLPLYRFSLDETDRLAAAVASGAVIDIGDNAHFNLFLMVELGRREIPFQLSETSWRTLLGYRPWPAPHYDRPMPFSIVLRSETNSGSPRLLTRTTQFDVMRQP